MHVSLSRVSLSRSLTLAHSHITHMNAMWSVVSEDVNMRVVAKMLLTCTVRIRLSHGLGNCCSQVVHVCLILENGEMILIEGMEGSMDHSGLTI